MNVKKLKSFQGLWLGFVILGLTFISCADRNEATPKPRTYPKVEFPEKKYVEHVVEPCGFSFLKAEYAKVEKDSLFFEEKSDHPCWFDVNFSAFNATIYCSYYEINEKHALDSLIYDSFALVSKHTSKAQFIEEKTIALQNNNGGGLLFKLSGPVASPTQFFLTDSTDNFIRGALYFNNKVNLDSMAVIYNFVNDDIEKMLESFSWNID